MKTASGRYWVPWVPGLVLPQDLAAPRRDVLISGSARRSAGDGEVVPQAERVGVVRGQYLLPGGQGLPE